MGINVSLRRRCRSLCLTGGCLGGVSVRLRRRCRITRRLRCNLRVRRRCTGARIVVVLRSLVSVQVRLCLCRRRRGKAAYAAHTRSVVRIAYEPMLLYQLSYCGVVGRRRHLMAGYQTLGRLRLRPGRAVYVVGAGLMGVYFALGSISVRLGSISGALGSGGPRLGRRRVVSGRLIFTRPAAAAADSRDVVSRRDRAMLSD